MLKIYRKNSKKMAKNGEKKYRQTMTKNGEKFREINGQKMTQIIKNAKKIEQKCGKNYKEKPTCQQLVRNSMETKI